MRKGNPWTYIISAIFLVVHYSCQKPSPKTKEPFSEKPSTQFRYEKALFVKDSSAFKTIPECPIGDTITDEYLYRFLKHIQWQTLNKEPQSAYDLLYCLDSSTYKTTKTIEHEITYTKSYLHYKYSRSDTTISFINAYINKLDCSNPTENYLFQRSHLLLARTYIYKLGYYKKAQNHLDLIQTCPNNNSNIMELLEAQKWYFQAVIDRYSENYETALDLIDKFIQYSYKMNAHYQLGYGHTEKANILLNNPYASTSTIKEFDTAYSYATKSNNSSLQNLISINKSAAYFNYKLYTKSDSVLYNLLSNPPIDSPYIISRLLNNAKYSGNNVDSNLIIWIQDKLRSETITKYKTYRLNELADYNISKIKYAKAYDALEQIHYLTEPKTYLHEINKIKIQYTTLLAKGTQPKLQINSSDNFTYLTHTRKNDLHDLSEKENYMAFLLGTAVHSKNNELLRTTVNELIKHQTQNTHDLETTQLWCRKNETKVLIEAYLLDRIQHILIDHQGTYTINRFPPSEFNNNLVLKIEIGIKPLKIKWKHKSIQTYFSSAQLSKTLSKSIDLNLSRKSPTTIFSYAISEKSELKQTYLEALSISQIFKSSKNYYGHALTPTNIQSSFRSSQIVHFATHGSSSEWDKDKNFICSPNEVNINMERITKMQTNSKLVFFNLCQPNKGIYIPGIGNQNIAQSTVKSGAHIAVVTTTRISDLEAKNISAQFYSRIDNSKEALLYVIKNKYHIYI